MGTIELNSNGQPKVVELLKASRVRGTIFTFFFTLSGFVMFGVENVDWTVAILSGLSFSFLHSSIMVFNDWRDRQHDLKKEKRLAYDYPEAFFAFWQKLTIATLVCVFILGYYNTNLALFCFSILAIGLVYSFVEQIIVLNNLLVAVCGASPMLAGPVYFGNSSQTIWLWYITFFLVIFAREIVKDIEDSDIDLSYKNTLSTNFGITEAKWISVFLLVVAGLFACFSGKAYEALMLQAVLIWRVGRWNLENKSPIMFFDILIGVLVLCLVVPQKYGTREVAMFDFWTVEHLFFGVMLAVALTRIKSSLSVKKNLVAVFAIAYSWEIVEYTMEMGYFGQTISNWKNGMEHWSNRLIGDPGVALLGAYLQNKWSKIWRWVVVPWLIWGIVNYLSPNSMYIQNFVVELFRQ